MSVAPVALTSRASSVFSGGMSPITEPRGRWPVTTIASPSSSSAYSSGPCETSLGPAAGGCSSGGGCVTWACAASVSETPASSAPIEIHLVIRGEVASVT